MNDTKKGKKKKKIEERMAAMQGNILYRFPSLQRTASSQKSRRKEYVGKKWAEAFDGARKFFQEKKWLFRLVSLNFSFYKMV